jgi:hypothetical protein
MPVAVIASEAKQSSPSWTVADCFVAPLLAMTPLQIGDTILNAATRLALSTDRSAELRFKLSITSPELMISL